VSVCVRERERREGRKREKEAKNECIIFVIYHSGFKFSLSLFQF
jgi:hypothetical protein